MRVLCTRNTLQGYWCWGFVPLGSGNRFCDCELLELPSYACTIHVDDLCRPCPDSTPTSIHVLKTCLPYRESLSWFTRRLPSGRDTLVSADLYHRIHDSLEIMEKALSQYRWVTGCSAAAFVCTVLSRSHGTSYLSHDH